MLIALCSVHGSPGVTTTTLALAAHWPLPAGTRRLVVECDPAGGELHTRLGLAGTPGLTSLAAASRHEGERAGLWAHAVPGPAETSVVTAPISAAHARIALGVLAPFAADLLRRERHYRSLVLADCGRMDPASPAEAIARRADLLVVISRARPADIARLAPRLPDLATWTPRPALLLTSPGMSTRDVESALRVRTAGRIPHDRAAAWRARVPRSRAYRTAVTAIARALTPAAPTATPPSPPSRSVDEPAGTSTGGAGIALAPLAHRASPVAPSPSGGNPATGKPQPGKGTP
ncbi:MinD/ParA family ATP-binding protein [Amycolatopsis benzoatilytica]|uniref:MinD/ParA family ATP-binding protein n=1 Tax=Amycolatopsis benzoatilytica TaxID=346045 RepID=UPI000376148C|nr:hypothetical protein [Amycolatopsis benzoatilytica]